MSQPHHTGQPGSTESRQPQSATGQHSPTFRTRNHLAEDVRAGVVEQLNRTLADTTVLLTHARFAHWNVRGPEFFALHQLFEDLAETLEDHADDLAERATALGGRARGTAGMAVADCSLAPMPSDITTGQQFLEVLADRLAVHDRNLYEAIEVAQDCGDLDTADLFNEVSRDVAHYLWLLEAHFQPGQAGSQ